MPDPTDRTPLWRLVNHLLPDGLAAYLTEQHGRPLRAIAADIRRTTDVSVSHETLRVWMTDLGLDTSRADSDESAA